MCRPLVVAINAEAGSATVVPGSGASAMDVPTAGGGPACEQGTAINAEAGSATVVPGSGASAMDVPTAGGGPACENVFAGFGPKDWQRPDIQATNF